MRWLVGFDIGRSDAERLVALELPSSLEPILTEHGLDVAVEMESDRVEHDDADFAWALREAVGSVVERRIAVLKLLHGHSIRHCNEPTVRSVRETGEELRFFFLSPRPESLTWEQYARSVADETGEEPTRPRSIDDVAMVDGHLVATLADGYDSIARGLHLLALALTPDDGLDWAAAYASFEVVDEHARVAGIDAVAYDWWTEAERRAFLGTANSPSVLGPKARHGRRLSKGGVELPAPTSTMTELEASWFLRGVYARFLRSLNDYQAAEVPASSSP